MRIAALLPLLALTSCGVATRINTQPPGAVVYINGTLIGDTPVVYDNDRGLPRRYHVEIYRADHEALDFYLDTRMSIGWGLAGALLFVPKLWAWSLGGEYTFKLKRQPGARPPAVAPTKPSDDEALDDEESLDDESDDEELW